MECKEGKPREDVDTGVQAAPPFWLRIVLRAALLALAGLAAEAFLTQDWPEFRHKLRETQPTTGYGIETTAIKAAPAVNHPVTEVSPTATAPITVDMIASPLRSGDHVLTGRLKNHPDRTQNVTVNENATPTIEFEMRVRRHTAKAKPTPAPSFLGKVGGSLKHLFGGNSTPPPRRKR